MENIEEEELESMNNRTRKFFLRSTKIEELLQGEKERES